MIQFSCYYKSVIFSLKIGYLMFINLVNTTQIFLKFNKKKLFLKNMGKLLPFSSHKTFKQRTKINTNNSNSVAFISNKNNKNIPYVSNPFMNR